MAYIADSLRELVIKRANNCCEYCLISGVFADFPHEIDHIVAEKHRGQTIENNLCAACIDCNRRKGTDICSLDIETNMLTRLYNPRLDRWSDHFRLVQEYIEPLTAVGRVSVFILAMNDYERLARRRELLRIGLYPCLANP